MLVWLVLQLFWRTCQVRAFFAPWPDVSCFVCRSCGVLSFRKQYLAYFDNCEFFRNSPIKKELAREGFEPSTFGFLLIFWNYEPDGHSWLPYRAIWFVCFNTAASKLF